MLFPGRWHRALLFSAKNPFAGLNISDSKKQDPDHFVARTLLHLTAGGFCPRLPVNSIPSFNPRQPEFPSVGYGAPLSLTLLSMFAIYVNIFLNNFTIYIYKGQIRVDFLQSHLCESSDFGI
jgi:hypothetical protein